MGNFKNTCWEALTNLPVNTEPIFKFEMPKRQLKLFGR